MLLLLVARRHQPAAFLPTPLAIQPKRTNQRAVVGRQQNRFLARTRARLVVVVLVKLEAPTAPDRSSARPRQGSGSGAGRRGVGAAYVCSSPR
jgi:hypothetical protein